MFSKSEQIKPVFPLQTHYPGAYSAALLLVTGTDNALEFSSWTVIKPVSFQIGMFLLHLGGEWHQDLALEKLSSISDPARLFYCLE